MDRVIGESMKTGEEIAAFALFKVQEALAKGEIRPDKTLAELYLRKGLAGALPLEGGQITGNAGQGANSAAGGGVRVRKGTFIMEGGAITGNAAQGGTSAGGGGVRVGEASTFTMKGGAISGNSAQGGNGANGGGVNVSKGTFTMEDGEISLNSINGNHGGGVRVDEESVFTMKAGKISGNTARNAAVTVSNGSAFTMKSGAITGNNSRGVHAIEKTTTFIMEGGEISGNSGQNAGQGVAVHYGTFTMKGGVIHGNGSTSKEGGGVAIIGDGLFEMYGGRIQGSKDSDGFAGNINNNGGYAALRLVMSRSKWGSGGTYTIGGVSKPGGSEIAPLRNDGFGGTDDTLIAGP